MLRKDERRRQASLGHPHRALLRRSPCCTPRRGPPVLPLRVAPASTTMLQGLGPRLRLIGGAVGRGESRGHGLETFVRFGPFRKDLAWFRSLCLVQDCSGQGCGSGYSMALDRLRVAGAGEQG